MKGAGSVRFLLAVGVVLASLLSGCRVVALPGREPFGERTYSAEQAQSAYEDVQAQMEQVRFSDWDGYSIRLDDAGSRDFYRTEEYTVAWHEGEGKTLWYQGRLYRMDGEALAWREMDWEELEADEYAAEQWEFARMLLAQEAEELVYKYIPMASGNQYLLTAEYPETEWDGQARRWSKLSFRMDEEGAFTGFGLSWQEGSRYTAVGYFPYEGSCDLQAERAVWSFAHALGLVEQGVPALSTQEEDREWCRSIISGIDFHSLPDRAEYREDLSF